MNSIKAMAKAYWEDVLGFELDPKDITAWIEDTVLDAMPPSKATNG